MSPAFTIPTIAISQAAGNAIKAGSRRPRAACIATATGR